MTVLAHIESIYFETKFEYLSLMDVLFKFPDKEDARRQLNDLRKQGIIRKRPGYRGDILIEYTGKLRTEFENGNN